MQKTQQTSITSFMDAIKDQLDGFMFGTLYRLNDRVLGGVVPILRENVDFKRAYKLVEEINEKQAYTVTDTGNISQIKVKLIGDEPIFIRSGTAFEGQGTQSRASEVSVIIMPEKREEEIIIPAR